MDNPITQGLTLSLIGLTIAFAFMALFILTMVVLIKLFPGKSAVAEEEKAVEPAAVIPAVVSEALAAVEEDEELAVVAAAAAAIASLRSLYQSKLGESLAESHGTWWVANQLAARQNK